MNFPSMYTTRKFYIMLNVILVLLVAIQAKEKERYMVKNLKVNKIRIKAQQCVNNLNKRFIDIKLYKHHQNTSLCSTQFCTRIFQCYSKTSIIRWIGIKQNFIMLDFFCCCYVLFFNAKLRKVKYFGVLCA